MHTNTLVSSLQAVSLLGFPLVAYTNPHHLPRTIVTGSATISNDAPLVARDDPQPSAYPYGDAYPGEWQYLGWDKDDNDQKKRAEKIHAAFAEWRDMASAGKNEADNPDGTIFKRWFSTSDSGEKKEITGVFANMWDDERAAPAAPVVKMVCEQIDFKKGCKATLAAYTLQDSGHFHVCPYGDGDRRPPNKDIQCANLDASASSKMRSLPMTLLHEMTSVMPQPALTLAMRLVEHMTVSSLVRTTRYSMLRIVR